MAQTSFVLKDSTQEESESIAVAGKNQTEDNIHCYTA